MAIGQGVHPPDQGELEVGRHRVIALGRAVLGYNSTCSTLRDAVASLQVADGLPASGRAHHFPRSRSFSIEMSRAWSATIA